MKLKNFSLLFLLAFIFTWSCQKDADVFAPVISGVEVDTVLNIGDKLVLAPDITNLVGIGYTWSVNGNEVASGQIDYTFTATEPGVFVVTFSASNKGGAGERTYKIMVEKPIAITLKNGLSVARSIVLDIEPSIDGPERNDYEYEWAIGDSIIGQTATLPFISVKPGDYTLTLTAKAGKQSTSASCDVKVEDAEYSSYSTSLLEYKPNYGNFSTARWLTPFKGNSTEFSYPYNEYLTAVSQHLKENYFHELHLGWWGGSAIFGFDHTVVNALKSTGDIQLQLFDYIQNEHVFWVAYDQNKNGKPDEDEWYEIKTDYWGKGDVIDYEQTLTISLVTFENGDSKVHQEWVDNQDEKGETMIGNGPWEQLLGNIPGGHVDNGNLSIYDGWGDTFIFKGRLVKTLVPRRGAGSGQSYRIYNINIADAVDKDGNAVLLPGADFLRVQNISMTYRDDNLEQPKQSYSATVRGIKDNHL